MLLIYFFTSYLVIDSEAIATPMYTYIKELCPPGMMTLTGARHVRTCNDECPRESSCIQGICCTQPVSCNHFTYKYPSQYSCLPRVKKNCPDDHKCVPSTREGMHICCKVRPSHSPPVPPEKAVCPASHPVISNNRQQLRLCSDCQKGVCAPFRMSSVSICCHSFTTFCGPGSEVEMDGLLARDCSKTPCSVGFECSLAPFGDRVCCSLAACSSGQRARAVCAAGCRKDEICEVINQQRWCCPIVKKKKCPNHRVSNGESCSPESSICADGYECEKSIEQNGYLCCQVVQPTTVAAFNRLKTFATSPSIAATTLTVSPVPTTKEDTRKCSNKAIPLVIDGEYLQCPELEAPCPKAGYTCEAGGNGGFHCCPLEVDIFETIIAPILTLPTSLPEKCKGCELETLPTEAPTPKCPYAFREARSPTSDEIKTCVGFLDFSCPFGFTCLPSSTTPTFLCCSQIIEI